MPRKLTSVRKLTPEQRQLVANNHNLIYGFLHTRCLPIDEYYDVCAIALCLAAVAYQEEIECSFASFACLCMAREVHKIWQALSADKRTGDVCSLDADYDNGNPLHEFIPGVDIMPDIDAQIDMERAINSLPPRQREIVVRRMRGDRWTEIGLDLKISHKAAQARVYAAKRMLAAYREEL